MTKEEKIKELTDLNDQMEKDMSLPLRDEATNLVFGEGNPETKAIFLGEGPGYWEDIKARPFVGNAGILLNKLLQSIKLAREDVFITNVVCFRPPQNRDPLPEEIAAFQPYVDKMIEIINPKIIVTLGRFSMSKFLPGAYISSVHGKVQRVQWKGKELIILPMYHPAAALRNGQIMLQLTNDFLQITEVLKEADKIEAEQMKLV